MKIAVSSRYLPSTSKMGVGYQVHYFANELMRRGHKVTVFTTCPSPADALYDVKMIETRPPMRSLRISLNLRREDWSKFDVLHAHGDDWFLWGRQVPPHIRTMHGSCLAEALHIPGLKGKLYMLWLAGLETLSCAVADQTVAVSENTRRSYPWIRQTIPNGVDLAAFYPGKKEARPTILFVGTYHNRKRGKFLMEIFQEQIRVAIPDAKLWMVCSDAPAAVGVEVLGSISTEDLADRYRRAWVFCLPSTYEGFGIPYIEAMASGTAVVASPNVGASEVLKSGRFGRIATDEELGKTIIELLLDAPTRASLNESGLGRAAEFSWNIVIPQYEKLYENSCRPN